MHRCTGKVPHSLTRQSCARVAPQYFTIHLSVGRTVQLRPQSESVGTRNHFHAYAPTPGGAHGQSTPQRGRQMLCCDCLFQSPTLALRYFSRESGGTHRCARSHFHIMNRFLRLTPFAQSRMYPPRTPLSSAGSHIMSCGAPKIMGLSLLILGGTVLRVSNPAAFAQAGRLPDASNTPCPISNEPDTLSYLYTSQILPSPPADASIEVERCWGSGVGVGPLDCLAVH